MKEADPEFVRLTHDVYTTRMFGHLQRGFTFLPKTDDLPYEIAVRLTLVTTCVPCPSWDFRSAGLLMMNYYRRLRFLRRQR